MGILIVFSLIALKASERLLGPFRQEERYNSTHYKPRANELLPGWNIKELYTLITGAEANIYLTIFLQGAP